MFLRKERRDVTLSSQNPLPENILDDKNNSSSS